MLFTDGLGFLARLKKIIVRHTPNDNGDGDKADDESEQGESHDPYEELFAITHPLPLLKEPVHDSIRPPE